MKYLYQCIAIAVVGMAGYAIGYSHSTSRIQQKYPQFYNLNNDSLQIGSFHVTYPNGQPQETYAIWVWTEEGWERVYLNQHSSSKN